MKNVKIKIEQVVKNGTSTLNATSFEVANDKKIDKDNLAIAFASSVCRRWNTQQMAKEIGAGSRIKFTSLGALNMVIEIGNQKAFDLSDYKSQTGIELKFPAYKARKEGLQAAKKILIFLIQSVIDEAEMFNTELTDIFTR